MGSGTRDDPKDWIIAFRQANEVLRAETGVSDLSASWVQILLFVAENEGQPLSVIERAVGMRTTSAQRAIQALGTMDRNGRSGLDLIDMVVDPRHGSRNLYFLSHEGRRLVRNILRILMGQKEVNYTPRTGTEYLMDLAEEQTRKPPLVKIAEFTPQEIATGKRSLVRQGITVGPHIVAFPLEPAEGVMSDIEHWVEGIKGKIYPMVQIAKPRGMVIVDLPSKQAKTFFRLRWLG